MKILIASLGTFGDLNPILGLAEGLKARGHEVTVATNKRYEALVKECALSYYEISPNFMTSREEFEKDPIEAELYRFDKLIRPTLAETYLQLEEIISGYDVYVSNSNIYANYCLASLKQIPWIMEILSPYSTGHPPKEQTHHPDWMPDVHDLLDRSKPQVLSALTDLMSALKNSFNSRTFLPVNYYLRLCLFSKHLCGVPDYWGENIEVTGFIFRDGKKIWPEKLERFLNAGSPPLVMTMGTAVSTMLGTPFYEPFIQAAKLMQKRMVILAGPLEEALRNKFGEYSDVLILKEAQNSKLFPRCCAVIHHGGIGTLAEAIKWQRPSLIAPFAYDQPFNAYHAEQHNIGHHILVKDCSSENISALLGKLLGDSSYKKALVDFSARMAQEDGVRAACDAIERFVPEFHKRKAAA